MPSALVVVVLRLIVVFTPGAVGVHRSTSPVKVVPKIVSVEVISCKETYPKAMPHTSEGTV